MEELGKFVGEGGEADTPRPDCRIWSKLGVRRGGSFDGGGRSPTTCER